MKFLEMFINGGIITWLIVICLLVGIVFIIQKFIEIKKHKVGIGSFSIRIRGLLKKKDIENAINFCTEQQSPLANILRRGLKKYKLGRKRVVESIESASRNEIKKLEKGLVILATLASGAPMLGLLGTIVGLMLTFLKAQGSPANVTQEVLSNGIGLALMPAAVGLVVGILLMGFYNYFVSVIGKNIHELEMMSVDIMDVLDSTDAEFSDDEIEPEDE